MEIDIPFGAKDSELKEWRYTIPEGHTAEIKNGEIIVKSTESEDERVATRLIHLIHTGGYLEEPSRTQILTWLEKQKELPTNEEMLRTLRAEYEKGVADTIAKYEQKEQKPEGVYVDCTKHPDWYGMPQKPNYCHYGGDPNIDRCRCCSVSCSGRLADEQKLAECSEVELTFRGEKVKVKRQFFRDDKGRKYSTTEQDEDASWYALRAWCEKKGVSLYDLYPNTEWNEEDEKMLTDISWAIRHCAYDDKKKERVMKWFNDDYRKFLRPSWKPSEEQMGALNYAYCELFKRGDVDHNILGPFQNLIDTLSKL